MGPPPPTEAHMWSGYGTGRRRAIVAISDSPGKVAVMTRTLAQNSFRKGPGAGALDRGGDKGLHRVLLSGVLGGCPSRNVFKDSGITPTNVGQLRQGREALLRRRRDSVAMKPPIRDGWRDNASKAVSTESNGVAPLGWTGPQRFSGGLPCCSWKTPGCSCNSCLHPPRRAAAKYPGMRSSHLWELHLRSER